MTPTTVGFVLVEGQVGDGATMERDAFAVHTDGPTDALHSSKQAAAAVRQRRPLSHVGALTMLVAAGAVTFVVSGSLAIGLQLTSKETPGPTEQRQIADTPASAAAVHPAPAFPPPLSVPAAPPPAELPAPIDEMPLAPPPAEPVDPPVVVAPDVAVPAEQPAADLPAAEPVAPLPQEPIAPPPLLPPPPIQQPVPPPLVQAPPERPGILSRIKDKLSGIGRNDGAAAGSGPCAARSAPAAASASG